VPDKGMRGPAFSGGAVFCLSGWLGDAPGFPFANQHFFCDAKSSLNGVLLGCHGLFRNDFPAMREK
jgi:hypothetical protein